MSSSPAAYDIGKVRSHFPALKEGAAHFDGRAAPRLPMSSPTPWPTP